MKNLLQSIIWLSLCFNFVTGTEMPDSNLVWLINNKIEVGILPQVGGRIVVMRKPGGSNLLKSDSTQWQPPWPTVSAQSKFIPYNGHIVWLGPQKKWWVRQSANLQRKKQKANWPPDPYLIYGNYEVFRQNPNVIILTGPDSPVSGVKLRKKIAIKPDGVVEFAVSAIGTRDSTLYWDIWMNTRMDGFDRAYVPVNPDDIPDFMIRESAAIEPTPYQYIGNYFTFLPSLPEKGEQVQEVHLNPVAPFIAGVHGEEILLIQFHRLAKGQVSPGHSQVELYNRITAEDQLLELEIHGRYGAVSKEDTLHMNITLTILDAGTTEKETWRR
ncbi:MAG: DUF4380 domain-containing protein [Fidelibacterota bacterium]